VDADYSALEPRCFAHMSGDKNLQNIFHSGEDMYSSIAKRVFNLDNVSTFKSDSNFLGKLYPEKRQIIKALALAVTYGAEAFRIADLLNISKEEAQKLIDDYLKAYPNLKKYINDSHYQAATKGYVKTIFGRVRHLSNVKELYDRYGYNLLDLKWAKQRGLLEERRKFKNGLNNSTNFRIQGLAAHIVNRAMLNIMRTLKNNNLNGYVCLQIHDQIVVHCPENEAQKTVEIVKHCMENAAQLSVPLVAEPKIGKNLKDSH
jgi:DNA polymerase-1